MRGLKLLLAMLLAIGVFGTTNALAQTKLPNRLIRLLVPFAPGGGGDVVARVIGKKLSEQIASRCWWSRSPTRAARLRSTS